MVKDGRAVLFIHIPKTGGTTIERLFAASGWKMHYRETRKRRPVVFPLLRCSPQHYHGALLTELFELGRFDLVVSMVRDPVARFRSEFAMRNPRLDSAPAATVDAWARKAFERYDADPYVHDNHLRPQTEFLVPGTEIYRLEDGMEPMAADLNARFDLGLGTEVPHRLKSGDNGLASSAVEISAEVTALLRDRYATDFEQLGYADRPSD